MLGGISYTLIELIWRGHTHVSMTLAGGVCLAGLYWIDRHTEVLTLLSKCIVGALAITAVEFLVGYVVNCRLGLGVWDYSDRFMNVMGQICPLFTFMWFLISLPAIGICRAVYKLTRNGEENEEDQK